MSQLETEQTVPRFRRYRNRWGHVSQFDIPRWLISKDMLSSPMLRVVTALFFEESEQPKADRIDHLATVSVSVVRLSEITGLCKATVSKAIRQLRQLGLIEQDLTIRNAKGAGAGFGTALYTLNGDIGSIDGKTMGWLRLYVTKGKRLLAGNGVRYVTIPRIVLSQPDAQYSMAKMSDSEFSTYLASLSKAIRDNTFTMQVSDVIDLTGLTSPTIEKALYALRSRGLMNGKLDRETDEITVELLDPATGKSIPPPVNDPQREPGSTGWTKYSRADMERLLRERLPPGRHPVTSTGNMNISCPLHQDRTPSLSVDLDNDGRWYCHECEERGTLAKLLSMLDGVPIDQTAPDLRSLEKVAPGKPVWTDEDYKTAIRYWYRTLDGKVIRWKTRNTRVKAFMWWHSVRGKYTSGIGPGLASLYHQELLSKAEIVVITEGEKDANAVTDVCRKLGHPIIGVTSGSSTSWEPRFAQLLKSFPGIKRAVVMPDDTPDGLKYADDITASLTAEDIPFTIVTFGAEECKDVSDFMLTHTADELLARINAG